MIARGTQAKPKSKMTEVASRRCKRELAAHPHRAGQPGAGRAPEVDYYGTPTPLNSWPTISAPEPRLLVIQPWDKSSLGAIEKAIQKSDLGINPTNDGKVIRLAIPRADRGAPQRLVKLVAQAGRGGAGRRAQHPPRRARRPAATSRTKKMISEDDAEARRGAAAEADRSLHRARSRSSARPKRPRSWRSDASRSADATGTPTDARPASSRTTSRSSWTATGAGRSSAGCRAWPATAPAPRTSARIIESCVELGVEVLTLYAFSTENWQRPDDEVAGAASHPGRRDRARDAGAAPPGRADPPRRASSTGCRDDWRRSIAAATALTQRQPAHHARTSPSTTAAGPRSWRAFRRMLADGVDPAAIDEATIDALPRHRPGCPTPT